MYFREFRERKLLSRDFPDIPGNGKAQEIRNPSCHPSSATMVDEVWHRLEAAWNEWSISVIQAQLGSMSNRVMAVLVARSDSCFF
ncbi:hypothetical protein TNCV_3027461 [Trichonephila clavipes]|nr:hypothetical protein TNCV_3027461 [Trichonephila clavipes]